MTVGMLERLPTGYFISQGWRKNATAGVSPDPNGTTVQQLVAAYGNYQPFGHDGIDFGCPMRSVIVAPGAGRVDFAGWFDQMPAWVANKYGYLVGDDSGGIAVLIDHGNGLLSALIHLDQTDLNGGDWVIGGNIVGFSGTTGRSGGPHLHWSLIVAADVYRTALYGRIDPLSRVPAGQSIPIAPGNTGAASTNDLIPGISGLSK